MEGVKSWRYVLLGVWVTWALQLPGAAPDDDYVRLYRQLQQADQLLDSGQQAEAEREFVAVRDALLQLRTNYPAWNPQVVEFRLRYLAQRLTTMAPQSPAAAAEPTPSGELDLLRRRVRDLEVDRDVLQAKLREALAARPAALDPRELANAEERIKTQQKQIEALQVRPDPGDAPGVTLTNRAKTRESAPSPRESATQREAALSAQTVALSQELAASRRDQAALEVENRTLHLQLNTTQQQLALARELPLHAGDAPSQAERVRMLEQEREEFAAKLDSVTRKLLESQISARATDAEKLRDELAMMRSRLEVLEARRAPFSAEELSRFRIPHAADTSAGGNPKQGASAFSPGGLRAPDLNVPSSGSRGSATANSAPSPLTSTNIAALTRLASAQIAQGRLADAERTLQRVLSGTPQDTASLALLGQVRFRQDRWDEALDALSRAAQLNPQDSETLTYLGLTLIRKGLREPAEATLWRAVQLAPTNDMAHYNLAALYVAQRPPLVELARYHYQQAVAAGLVRDAAFEQRLRELPSPIP
jgi:Flp pilus assembly protein TadD